MKKVLLVKPKPQTRELYSSTLRALGWEVISPDSLRQAVEELTAIWPERFDLIITGLRMPDQPDHLSLLGALWFNSQTKIIISTDSAWAVPKDYKILPVIEEPCDINVWRDKVVELDSNWR